ncbi:MAG: AraC family ligand binding domain-containing protein [Agriterribacter sp.]
MISIRPVENCDDLIKPRRIMKYVLIYCSSGSLVTVVDDKEFNIAASHLITITSGQFHYLKKIENAKGFVTEFTLDFFGKNDNDIELIFQNGLFCHFAMNEVIQVDKSSIDSQLKMIAEELKKQPYQYLISIRSRIELILVDINRAKIDRGDEVWKPDALFLKFLETVRSNFEYNYSVKQFAKMLSTTEIKLNELAKLHAGKTVHTTTTRVVKKFSS